MDDDVIEDLADAFANQLENLNDRDPRYSAHKAAIHDNIIAIAVVIHNHEPTYDLRYYYKRAGYPEPYPVHEM